MDRMRPMSEAPPSGTAVWLWFEPARPPMPMNFWRGKWVDDDGRSWIVDSATGWTPRTLPVRPLEPRPPEHRLRLQIQSAAQESVALGQPLAKFVALAGVAHAQAAKRAARVGR